MKVEILASGSKANCYALTSGGETILLDCGRPFETTLAKLGYKLPSAILLTHEHTDHSRAVKNFLERGVEIYMTRGTAAELKLRRHNLNLIGANWSFQAGKNFFVKTLESVHDAAQPINFIIEDKEDRLLYQNRATKAHCFSYGDEVA